MSNISVSVEWDRSIIFAGEEVRCTITFKNTSNALHRSRSPSPSTQRKLHETARDRWKTELPQWNQAITKSQGVNSTGSKQINQQLGKHRPMLSLSAPVGSPNDVSFGHNEAASDRSKSSSRGHKRSVSIISISGAPVSSTDQNVGSRSGSSPHGRRGHLRAASFQSRGSWASPSDTTASSPTENKSMDINFRSASSSPLEPQKPFLLTRQQARESLLPLASRNSKTRRSLPFEKETPARAGKPSSLSSSESSDPRPSLPKPSPETTTFQNEDEDGIAPIEHENLPNVRHPGRQLQRVLSPGSVNGTPRSSLDIYSQSNNSTETLASEYLPPAVVRQPFRTNHGRQSSRLMPPLGKSKRPEVLMMGYVQLMGSFTLDGSLISLSPFESVKKKGVIGGQGGGGVVGVESSKRDSSLFGSLGWSNIGQSLGGLLGSQDPSSIREMKGIASNNSIPIITTPQSILFVDLKLSPGESKSYSYRHNLPGGIPPTHRGRAMKASYHIVIGTQRPRSATQQHSVRHIDVPFKVLPGINSTGEPIIHDLMSPHILLKDEAQSHSIDHDLEYAPAPAEKGTPEKADPDSGFVSYVQSLLEGARRAAGAGLLSPTEPVTPGIFQPMGNEDATMKELIDMAVSRSGPTGAAKKATSHFQIQRGGQQIAAVMLARPSYRLGETISVVVDFGDTDVPCYLLHVSLETTEIVDPGLALRSSASIHRATRRVYAQRSETTICARRTAFGFVIPRTATPEFKTSAVELQWNLRLEFITGSNANGHHDSEDLLEAVADDERGTTLAAAQELACESFDVVVPIRVYGSMAEPDGGETATEYLI